MEPATVVVSIAAILSSATSLTLNTLEVLRRLKRSNAELESQLSEIVVVIEVLQECEDIVQASQNTKIPRSIERALAMCDRRFQELAEHMNLVRDVLSGLNSPIGKFKRAKTLMTTETERKSAFKNFRSVVLLLRDLCSDIRLQQQLVDMSAGLADLFTHRYDGEPPQRDSSRPGHIYLGEEPKHSTDEPEAEKPLDTPGSFGNWPQIDPLGQVFKELITHNFTRNATIVLDCSSEISSPRAKYVHLRAKMDTGCDENLITMDVVRQAQIDQSLLVPIREEDQFEFTMLNGFSCEPESKVTLSWYQDGDGKMRHSDFYVVREGPFDMLIGSRRFAQDFKEHALPVGKRKKDKATRKRQQEEYIRHLIDEQIEEIRERNDHKSKYVLQGLHQQGMGSQTHAGSAAPVQLSQGVAILSLAATSSPPSTTILPGQQSHEQKPSATPPTSPPSPLPPAPHTVTSHGQTSPGQGQTSPGRGPMSPTSPASSLPSMDTKPLPTPTAGQPYPSPSLSPGPSMQATLASPQGAQGPQNHSQQSQVSSTAATSQTPQLVSPATNQTSPAAILGALAPQLSSASYTSSLSASHGAQTPSQASPTSTNTEQNGTPVGGTPSQTVGNGLQPSNNGNNAASGPARKRRGFHSFLRTRQQKQ